MPRQTIQPSLTQRQRELQHVEVGEEYITEYSFLAEEKQQSNTHRTQHTAQCKCTTAFAHTPTKTSGNSDPYSN